MTSCQGANLWGMGQRTVEAVAARFCAGSDGAGFERHPGGHIHDTWMVSSRYGDVVLQRLNDSIFTDCMRLVDNVERVIHHLRTRIRKAKLPESERRVLTPVRADGGLLLVYDDEGHPWRAFRRVERAASVDAPATPDQAFQIGRGLGRFFAEIQDLPGGRLPEPIPGFKDFERRRLDFDLVVEADPCGRAATCAPEISAVRNHRRILEELAAVKASGRLRRRIVHNDAKAGNVLLDRATGEAMCVCDLDTVGTGSVLHDVGDLLRSSTVTKPEDAGDPRAVAVRGDLLEAALAGYLRETGLLLSSDELDHLPMAGPLMAYESALRFLTDHLLGDVYFRIVRPGHNLHRTRVQLRILEELDAAGGRVAEIVRRHTT
jgi:Ser/Thr protein kinase RdoA (MazF antagonist)